MYSAYDTACAVGCPIRISTDQRLLAAPRGFSQRATSFIASWCQGIHRMPFLYSISRFGPLDPNLTMHRNHPQGIRMICWKYCVFRTQHDRLRRPFLRVACATRRKIHPVKSFIAPLNPRCPTVGASSTQHEQITIPSQTSRPNNGTVNQSEDRSRVTRAQRRTRT